MTGFRKRLVVALSASAAGAVAFAVYVVAAEKLIPSVLASDLEKTDRIVVRKSERTLELYSKGRKIASYLIALGGVPAGHKQKEGDEKTPEGEYVIDWRNERSGYYKSLHISYPNAEDEARAREKGESPGGLIMIHGQKNRFGWLAPLTQRTDWTDGCIAVTNREMEEIWRSVDDGTPILIEP